jgi:putative toxin-antitoxin system antitoxin component (TIGR02293 family)
MRSAIASRRLSIHSPSATTVALLNQALASKRVHADTKSLNFLEVADDGATSITFSSSAAESAVRQGLKASLIEELAEVSTVEPRHLWAFIGLDRTTILRRVARDDALPQDASVKALQFADLFGLAMGVFADPDSASTWLTKPHPALDGETPMQRARTPWGMERVRSILGALQYGGAV